MTSNTKPTNAAAGLYRTIWRWHFYAGIFCIPFVITLAITGTIYLFKPQIDGLVDKPYRQLTMTGERSSVDAQVAAALAKFPNAGFLNYQLPQTPTEAVVVSVLVEGERHQVYVNPYTLAIVKSVPYEQQFIQLVRTFHGELLAGNVGSVVVELAGAWAIVLIVSGLYLWWPRNSNGLAGVVFPRIRKARLKKEGRIFWRDLHAALGFWVSAFTLFLLISGLPWALVWGSAFKEARQLITEQAVAHAGHEGHVSQDLSGQDWSLSQQEEAASFRLQANNGPIHLSVAALTNVAQLDLAHPVELSIDPANSAQWIAKSQHQNRMLRANVWMHNETGEVVKAETFSEKGLLDRVIGIGISAHEGHLFGWLNQLLGLFTTMALFTIAISGLIMWYQRKPEGGLGAPRRLPNAAVGKGVVMITLSLALFLPLLAISLISLLLLEWLLLKRLRHVSLWLGLNYHRD
jgi:uncharacterized iron-regulated membrane protein